MEENTENPEPPQKIIQEIFLELNMEFVARGAKLERLREDALCENNKQVIYRRFKHLRHLANFLRHYLNYFLQYLNLKIVLFSVIFALLLSTVTQTNGAFIRSFYETRCLVPNNYLIWEFSRPVSNCDFCRNITEPLVLGNISKEDFAEYAYSSRPIVVKGAARHWEAAKVFSLQFFKNLYEEIEGSYASVEEECQFLHFKSNFTSLKEVFEMSESRAKGQQPWYVGWKNCHPQVLEVMRKYYRPPHFLPDDAEVPQTNYVFLGYEQGAIMHLDYIPRLMWQGQLIGDKTWTVAPTPECNDICNTFSFSVNSGDIILLDTRLWYHGTFVENGQLSLTVTSEYG